MKKFKSYDCIIDENLGLCLATGNTEATHKVVDKQALDEALKLIGELEKAMVLLVDRQDKAEKELKNKGASFTSDMLVRNLKAKITKIKAFKESIGE